MSIVTEYGTVQVHRLKNPLNNRWEVIDLDTNAVVGRFEQGHDALDLVVYINDMVAEYETRVENAEQELRDFKQGLRQALDSFHETLDNHFDLW